MLEQSKKKKLSNLEEPKENSKKRKLENGSIEEGSEDSLITEEVKQVSKPKAKRKRMSNDNTVDEVNKFAVKSKQVNCIDESEHKIEKEASTDKQNALNSEQKSKKRKRKLKNVIQAETNISEQVNGIGSDAEVEDLYNEEKGKPVTDSSGTGFTILGDNKFNKKYKVRLKYYK